MFSIHDWFLGKWIEPSLIGAIKLYKGALGPSITLAFRYFTWSFFVTWKSIKQYKAFTDTNDFWLKWCFEALRYRQLITAKAFGIKYIQQCKKNVQNIRTIQLEWQRLDAPSLTIREPKIADLLSLLKLLAIVRTVSDYSCIKPTLCDYLITPTIYKN